MKINRAKKAAIIFIVLVFLAPAFVRVYTVNGPSMSPTLLFHDKVIAFLAAYDFRIPYTDWVLFSVGNPNRGDLILYYDTHKENVAIKRVIGLPGDSIELRENIIYVNELAAEQEVLSRKEYGSIPSINDLGELVLKEMLEDCSYSITYTPQKVESANHGPVVVPVKQYFILGDNRDNSHDSRFIGFIDRDQIKGRVIYGARD